MTVVAFLLSKILGLFNFKRQKSEAPISAKTANLADPIGAMSIVAQKYNDFHFLKDIAFLEVQLFGRNSNEVIEQFRSAESDPRPEVCGACANKMLLRISQERNIRLNNGRWSHEQEESWERGTPREWRLVIDQFSKAS